MKPIIGLIVDGGVLQAVVSDNAEALRGFHIVLIDYDTEGGDDDAVTLPHGERAFVRLVDVEAAEINLQAIAREAKS